MHFNFCSKPSVDLILHWGSHFTWEFEMNISDICSTKVSLQPICLHVFFIAGLLINISMLFCKQMRKQNTVNPCNGSVRL